MKTSLATRRGMLKGLSGLLGMLGLTTLVKAQTHQGHSETTTVPHSKHTGNNHMLGTVNHKENGFDPMLMLVDFDYGKVSTLPSGQTLREYTIYAEDKEIEIAPRVKFMAWTYNGRVPGPSFRCTEGDRLRIKFVNTSSHPHTVHFHGIHPAEMDGTTLTPTLKTVDTISQVQGQRGILEFSYKFPGQYMFHPHISEFTELGWMGHFNVVKVEDYDQALEQSGVDQKWHQKSMGGKGGAK